ncbi:MAG: hypothetical protein LWX83_09970 [Anaerolineae bacterium]|nr:hypothetical protein [Anaerolineae bacterium]
MKSSRLPALLPYVMILLLALMSAAALTLATRWGPGVGGDATIYMTSAQNLVNGRGLGLIDPQGNFRLLPYFPPFLSLVLSAISLTGADMLSAVRWLNIFCFAGLVYLAGDSTYRFSRSWLAGLLASFVIAFSPVLIPVYSWAMSEPLSAFLGFSALVLVVYYLQKPHKQPLFLSAALLSGLSLLTRYAALAFVLTGAAAILFLLNRSWRERFIKAVSFGLIALIPMLIWIVYDVLNTTTVGSRSMETLADMIGRFYSFWPLLKEALLFWLIPESWFYQPLYPSSINSILVPAAILILAAWSACLFWQMRRRWSELDKRFLHLFIVLAGFILLYLLIIFGVYLTTYPPITIANRMLSPIHTAILWMITLLGAISFYVWKEKRLVYGTLVFVLICFSLFYGWRSVRIVKDYYESGLGYTSLAWQQSPTIAAVRDLPADTLIVTNETNAVLFLTGRSAYPLAEIYQDKPAESFSRFGDGNTDKDDGQKLFKEGKAVFVLFDTIDDQISGLYGERTAERISALVTGLNRSFRGEDGGIFYYPTP